MPGAVRNLVATSYSIFTITLTWDILTGGAAGITSISIIITSTSTMSSNVISTSGTATLLNVTSLFPITEYQFQVITTGPIGNSLIAATTGRTLSMSKKLIVFWLNTF